MEDRKWYYQLPNGTKVSNQKEGCYILKIGRNAFRNRVKSGIIRKVTNIDKPKGYYEENSN